MKTLKPFSKQTFFLDLKGSPYQIPLAKDLVLLGGKEEHVFSKDVSFVVSNRIPLNHREHSSSQNNLTKSNWCPLTPLSTSNSPNPRQRNEYSSQYSDLPAYSNSFFKNQNIKPMPRGMALVQKAIAQKKQGSTDLIEMCKRLGVKVYKVEKVLAKVKKLKSLYSAEYEAEKKKQEKKDCVSHVTKLKPPFIKFESIKRNYKPVFKEFSSWAKVIDPSLSYNVSQLHKQFKISGTIDCLVSPALKEKKGSQVLNPDFCSPPTPQSLTKSYTKLSGTPKVSHCTSLQLVTDKSVVVVTKASIMPQAGELKKHKGAKNKKPTKRKAKQSQYCEICHTDFLNLNEHLNSDKHMKYVRDSKNFKVVENILTGLPKFEDFYKSVLVAELEDCDCRDPIECCRNSSGINQSEDNCDYFLSQPTDLTHSNTDAFENDTVMYSHSDNDYISASNSSPEASSTFPYLEEDSPVIPVQRSQRNIAEITRPAKNLAGTVLDKEAKSDFSYFIFDDRTSRHNTDSLTTISPIEQKSKQVQKLKDSTIFENVSIANTDILINNSNGNVKNDAIIECKSSVLHDGNETTHFSLNTSDGHTSCKDVLLNPEEGLEHMNVELADTISAVGNVKLDLTSRDSAVFDLSNIPDGTNVCSDSTQIFQICSETLNAFEAVGLNKGKLDNKHNEKIHYDDSSSNDNILFQSMFMDSPNDSGISLNFTMVNLSHPILPCDKFIENEHAKNPFVDSIFDVSPQRENKYDTTCISSHEGSMPCLDKETMIEDLCNEALMPELESQVLISTKFCYSSGKKNVRKVCNSVSLSDECIESAMMPELSLPVLESHTIMNRFSICHEQKTKDDSFPIMNIVSDSFCTLPCDAESKTKILDVHSEIISKATKSNKRGKKRLGYQHTQLSRRTKIFKSEQHVIIRENKYFHVHSLANIQICHFNYSEFSIPLFKCLSLSSESESALRKSYSFRKCSVSVESDINLSLYDCSPISFKKCGAVFSKWELILLKTKRCEITCKYVDKVISKFHNNFVLISVQPKTNMEFVSILFPSVCAAINLSKSDIDTVTHDSSFLPRNQVGGSSQMGFPNTNNMVSEQNMCLEEPLNLSTHFPRKMVSDTDFSKTLKQFEISHFNCEYAEPCTNASSGQEISYCPRAFDSCLDESTQYFTDKNCELSQGTIDSCQVGEGSSCVNAFQCEEECCLVKDSKSVVSSCELSENEHETYIIVDEADFDSESEEEWEPIGSQVDDLCKSICG